MEWDNDELVEWSGLLEWRMSMRGRGGEGA